MKTSFIYFIFLFASAILFYGCSKKEEIKKQPVCTSFLAPGYICGDVDSIFIAASYEQSCDNGSSGTGYNSQGLSIWRYSSIDPINPHREWMIMGNNINLDQINYPHTFWSRRHPPDYNGIYVVFGNELLNQYFPDKDDSTQFSITIDSFDHDTLVGSFQGNLFGPGPYLGFDSTLHVTNGSFKVIMKSY